MLSGKYTIEQLESKLEKQKDPKQRLILLDQAATSCVFTNIRKAQKLLDEQNEILKYHDNPDLRLNFLINLALIENQQYNYKLAEMHFIDAIEILEERGGAKQQAEAYIDFVGTLINQKELKKANEYLDKAKTLLNKFPDPHLSARLIAREGFTQLHAGNYSDAIELLLKADKQFTDLPFLLSIKDNYFLSLIHSSMGIIYSRNGEGVKCVKAFTRVLDLCKANKMHARLSWHYSNVGTAFMALEDYEEAQRYFEKAIAIIDDISQHSRGIAYANLGYCYFKKGSYTEALNLYNKGEFLFTEKGDVENLFRIERWRAELYKELGKNKKVKEHLMEAYKYANMQKNYLQLSTIFKDIAIFYESIGKYEDAYKHLLNFIHAEERFKDILNSRRMMELEVKYETEKKKREAELLELKTTQLQLKALRAQMNPHFLFNALNSIQNYITSNDPELAAKYLADFSILMRQSLEYSEYEIIPLEKEIEFLENYLSINQKLRFENNLTYEILIDDDIEYDIIGVPTMIIQPYVENAIEHGLRQRKEGKLRVKFSIQDDDTIICVVEDNGIGRDAVKLIQERDQYHNSHRSMGTSITENRLKLLHKDDEKDIIVQTIDLKDEKTGEALGTKVIIPIPITEL